MELAVKQFFDYQPASQWAFDVTFSNPMLVSKKSSNGTTFQLESTNTFTPADLQRISQSVVSVTQPKFDIEPYTNCYGNFDFVVPIYDVNNIRLKITFEDTDDCLISYKFLTSLMGGSVASGIPAWLNIHETILISITEYNTYDYDITRPNTYAEQMHNWNTTSVKSYFCKLVEYTEPNYNRNSEDASATTLTLTFLAVPAYVTTVDNTLIISNGVEDIKVTDIADELMTQGSRLLDNLKFTIKTAAGYMVGQRDLKDIYAQMKKDLGDRMPVDRKEISDWFTRNGIAQKYLGVKQCARGPNMLMQLTEYTENVAKGVIDETKSVMYTDSLKADVMKKGTGTSQEFKNSVKEVATTRNVQLNTSFDQSSAEAELNKLQAGDYATFSYMQYDSKTKTYVPSQHVVYKGYDNKFYSDFAQNSNTGIVNGKDFKFTGVYNIMNKPISSQNTVQQTTTTPAQPAEANLPTLRGAG